MIDKYFSWNIDGVQANTVLEGAEIEVPIDSRNYSDIFTNKDIVKELQVTDYCAIGQTKYNNTNIHKMITKEIKLSYFIKNGKYRIGYNYNKIFNNILKNLGGTGNIDIKDIDKHGNIENYNKFILKFRRELAITYNVRGYDGLNNAAFDKVFDNLYKNCNFIIDSLLETEEMLNYFIGRQICEEKRLRDAHHDLKFGKEKHISWKNLMNYTAIKALHEFDKTDDIRYYRYAKNYYKNLGCNPTAESPKSMYVDGIYYTYSHNMFNAEFKNIQGLKFQPILVQLNVEDKENIAVSRTLKKGKGLKATISDDPKPTKKADSEKIKKSLERKIKFYKGLSSKTQGIISDAFSADTDYIGYVLPNNYVVLDKFYDISKDGTKIVPSYGARVYIVTLDVYEACDRDRSKISDYIKKNHDYKAMRFNHNDTDSYQKEVIKVLGMDDISFTNFKEYKLKYKNN